MPDAYFSDEYLASLYDVIENHGRQDEAFYLALVRSADRVLDIGCGTGFMLHAARDAGHAGRLVGLDPAAGMLQQARRRTDIEWVQGYLPESGFVAEFDLAYMTGHAFQVLLDDTAVLEVLHAARRALVPGGHFAFETRNPHARAWEQWTPEHAKQITDAQGRQVRVWHEVERVDGELVTFTERFAVAGQLEPRVSRSTLRFMTAEHLDHLLGGAGFAIDERYGDWDRCLMTPKSREIITVARAVS
ncbi:MAG TPA: class I SAM-dependent methyltransferase [Jatrophihabitans sp.]|nr:class I SAM-dependent methyltransferase [Jatrophihabitans sp.]